MTKRESATPVAGNMRSSSSGLIKSNPTHPLKVTAADLLRNSTSSPKQGKEIVDAAHKPL